MTKIDAQVIQRNARSNRIIDGIVAKMKAEHMPRVAYNMVDKVLRPYAHVLNECETHSVDPAAVLDALTAVVASMVTEYMARTTPAGNATMIQEMTQTILDETSQAILTSLSAHFNVKFDTGTTPAPPSPLLHS